MACKHKVVPDTFKAGKTYHNSTCTQTWLVVQASGDHLYLLTPNISGAPPNNPGGLLGVAHLEVEHVRIWHSLHTPEEV